MEDIINEQLNEADVEFVIISKTKSDILNELDFEDEEERLLCDTIISNLEKTASDAIRDMKAVQLPYIGCLRINPVKRKLRDAKLHLSAVRKSLTKEQYKDHVRSYVVDLKEQLKEEDRVKLLFTRIRRNNKERYEQLFKKCGKAYAELFIMSIYWLKEVPFDAEWQEKYDELSGIDRSTILEEDERKQQFVIEDYLKAQPRYKFK